MNNFNNIVKKLTFLGLALLPVLSFAGETGGNPPSYFANPLFNVLLFIIIILAIVVIALGAALKNLISAGFYLEKLKREKQRESSGTKAIGLVAIFSLIGISTYAQNKTVPDISNNLISGLDSATFCTMVITIFLELITLGVLLKTLKNVLHSDKPRAIDSTLLKPKTKTILDRLNDTVEIEEEGSIMLDHDYDGIRELDNNLPPWWKYGFYLTILVSVIYLINYHIAKTGPLQAEEYKNSLRKAEAEIAEFMKTSANNVDESTVKMLTDPADIAAGKDLFIGSCAACHGKFGEGTVGPNLTDDYWMQGGSISEIFKTVKYGRPDKGMKSWKEDFSPMQIAQLTSFIRTLKGTNPPKPKAKQGELYIEKILPIDSAATKSDTLVKSLTSQVIK